MRDRLTWELPLHKIDRSEGIWEIGRRESFLFISLIDLTQSERQAVWARPHHEIDRSEAIRGIGRLETFLVISLVDLKQSVRQADSEANEKYKTRLSIRIGSLSNFYTCAYKTNDKYKTNLSIRIGSLSSFYTCAYKTNVKYKQVLKRIKKYKTSIKQV